MVKREIKKSRGKRTRKIIKDKATVNFLLEHLRPSKIDFSKIKIPSFLSFSDEEKEKSNHLKQIRKDDDPKGNENPIFGMSLLKLF